MEGFRRIKMKAAPFKGGLFARLLMLCVVVCVTGAAVVTMTFYSYREALTENRLVAELSALASATAPLVADRLAANDVQGATGFLHVFGGLDYVTCVDLSRDGLLLASWPTDGCDGGQNRGIDQLACLAFGDVIAGDDIHPALMLCHHDNSEGRLFALFLSPPRPLSRLRTLDAIADDVLHEFDKDGEYIANLRPIAGMVLQPLAQRVADGEKNIL